MRARGRLSFVTAAVTLLTLLACAAHAQQAVRIRVAANGAPAAAAPIEPMPPPEKGVVIDLKSPWHVRPETVQGTVATLYSLERGDRPTFRVATPNAGQAWRWLPRMYAAVDRYPIVRLKYRATNIDPNAPYTLRLVYELGHQVHLLLPGSEVVADGKVHEWTKDLRELGLTGGLSAVGFAVHANKQGDASLTVHELAVLAPDDAPAGPLEEDTAFQVTVTDPDGQPLGGARVTVDFERRNFARSGTTGADGTVKLPASLKNEAGQHTLRAEKDGFVARQLPPREVTGESATIALTRGSHYGGVAKGADGAPLAGARVEIAVGDGMTPVEGVGFALSDALMTDAEGRWTTTTAFPADASQVRIAVTSADGSTNEIAAADAQVTAPAQSPVAANAPATQRAAVASAAAGAKRGPASTQGAKGKRTPDVLQKVDGATLTGEVVALDAKTIRIKSVGGAEPVAVPMQDVVEVTFKAGAAPATQPKPAATPKAAGPNSAGGIQALARMVGIRTNNNPNQATPTPAPAPSATRPANAPPPPPAGSWQFHLAVGDTIYGKVDAWSGRTIKVKSASLAEPIELPVDRVRQIWVGKPDQINKAKALSVSADAQDVAYVANKDEVVSVAGIANGIEGTSLLFTFNDQQRKIALSRLVGMTFGSTDTEPAGRDSAKPAVDEFAFRQSLKLRSGETISGQLQSLDRGVVAMDSVAAGTVKVPLEKVEKLLVRNGRLVYLTDLTPAKVEQVPYFDRVVPYRIDKSLAGSPLKLADGPTTRGVSMHSRTLLSYDVGGKFNEFKARLGFQQPEGKLGRAAVRVLGDGKVLFEQPDARGDRPPADVAVKLEGVKQLTLEVDFGDGEDVGDWVVFAEPRLLREGVE